MTNLVRRDALSLSGMAILGTAAMRTQVLGPVVLTPARSMAGAFAGAKEITEIRDAHAQVHGMGSMAGGGTLRPAHLVGQFRGFLSVLTARFRNQQLRAEAHAAVALFGETAGFNLFDVGLHDQARRVWITSLNVARGAGTQAASAQAILLCNLASQAVFLNDPEKALRFLSMVNEWDLSGPARSLVDGHRARAAAVMGDLISAQDYIAASERHFSDRGDPEPWNLRRWYDRAEMEGEAGNALAVLAQEHDKLREPALEFLTRSVEAYRTGEPRSRAVPLIAKARLHAVRHESDAALATTSEALGAVHMIDSPRVASEIRTLPPLLRPMRRQNSAIDDILQAIDRVIAEKRTTT